NEQFARHVQYAGFTHAEAGYVDRVPRLAANDPGELVCLRDISLGRLRLQSLDQLLFLQVGRYGEFDQDRLPADVLFGQRLLFRFRQGALHSVGEALREHHSVLLVAVVVLTRTDVPPGAVEVDVQGFGDGLTADESCDPGEVGAGDARSVIALGVTGVVTERRD